MNRPYKPIIVDGKMSKNMNVYTNTELAELDLDALDGLETELWEYRKRVKVFLDWKLLTHKRRDKE